MKYKLVATDMDGTLLNSSNQVSERTKKAIENAKAKGVHVVLSTGRVLKSALSYSRTLDLRNPIVACNGAIIVDETGNIIYRRPIDNSLVKEIVNIARNNNIYYHFYDENRFYSHTKVDEILKFYSEGDESNRIDIKIFDNIEEITKIKDLNIYKFLFVDDDKNKLQNLRTELNKLNNIETSSSWSNNIEAMGLNVSKGMALSELCNNLKINPEEVIAIGDNENDLSMINFAGLGVAMENGAESIKKQADYVTASNDEDGVAKVIEKFVLE
ncbi:Cof-type HAD-IIB family hydrolase [Tissierella praeacuta]|uniref:Cof-type HAD-IIB family hydrolase n=1 Tax=Tissierella praeacuta TaxID=43131 RepID=UPI00333F563F